MPPLPLDVATYPFVPPVALNEVISGKFQLIFPEPSFWGYPIPFAKVPNVPSLEAVVRRVPVPERLGMATLPEIGCIVKKSPIPS